MGKKKNNKIWIISIVSIFLIAGIGFGIWQFTKDDEGALGASSPYYVPSQYVYCDVPISVLDAIPYNQESGTDFPVSERMEVYINGILSKPNPITIAQEGRRLGLTDASFFDNGLSILGLYIHKTSVSEDFSLLTMPSIKVISLNGGIPTSCVSFTQSFAKKYYKDVYYSKSLGLYMVCSANDRFLWVFKSSSDAVSFDRYNKICPELIPQAPPTAIAIATNIVN